MRRIVEGTGEPIRLNAERRSRLKEWLKLKHDNALSGRHGIEQTWKTCLRMYQGTPAEKRWLPFDNAPHIEVTIGASAADAIYSQALDLIFQVNPPVTVRYRKQDFELHAEAAQDYCDWGVNSGKWGFRPAVKTGLGDDTQLGSFIFYIPWTQTVRKTDIHEVTTFGPRIYAIAPEDFIIPVSSDKDVQQAEFCTLRLWYSKEQLNLNARMRNWNIDDAASTSDTSNAIRHERLRSAGLADNDTESKRIYAIADTFAYFDIDGDGIAEDLEIIWNMTTGGILWCGYNRWDCRPFILESFQDRPHIAYGLGPVEMMMPFEIEATETHNNRIWNMMIANTKIYVMLQKLANEVKEIYPGLVMPVDDMKDAPQALDMGSQSNTPVQSEMMTLSLARERTGVNDMNAAARLGGRTPGITALTAQQSGNRRFTGPYDNIRNGIAEAVMQCLYRTQEQVRMEANDEDQPVREQLAKILGADKAAKLVELFMMSEYEISDALDIELTASSVSVNRESDRQNMIMLAGLYEKYIGFITQMAPIKAQHPFAGADELIDKGVAAVNEFMRKILRTFDQVTDVEGFLLDLDQIQPAQVPGLPPELAQLMQSNATNPPPSPNGGPPLQ